MRLDEYVALDGLALAELVRRRQVTPFEVAAAMAAAYEQCNPSLNAVIELYEDAIDTAAPAIDSARGVFAGVPFLRKDLHDQAGQRTELGSRLAKGRRTWTSSLALERLERSGMHVVGRTAVPELGLSSTTESVAFGATRNPWNPMHTAGGSSGGAAAAVAAGIVPLADASDGGGSIRIPASCCGLVGLKPSRGRVSLAPARDEWGFGIATNLVVSRTVRDTAAALDVIGRPAPGDPFIIPRSSHPYRVSLDRPPAVLRIAFTNSPWNPMAIVDGEIRSVVIETARTLDWLGHAVTESSPNYPVDAATKAMLMLFSVLIAETVDDLAAELGRTPSTDNLEPVVWDAYQLGCRISARDLVRALRARNEVTRAFGEFFGRYDVLVTPTLVRLPPLLGELSTERDDLGFAEYWALLETVHPHLAVFNLAGLPAISLPLGISDSGLPIGVQFVAKFGAEETLLRLAAHLEQARPWAHRRPTITATRPD